MRVSFTLPEPTMPRTVFYEALTQAVRRNPRFIEDPALADVLLPTEDIAFEINWPRYGEPKSAFVRGELSQESHRRRRDYLLRLAEQPQLTCIPNMNPFPPLARAFADKTNLVIGEVSLTALDRLLNRHTISLPALPLNLPRTGAVHKQILASFRGAPSHPCRDQLRAIHDGRAIICELVPPDNHIGHIDARAGKGDERYQNLLAASCFAFVPRGDRLFSYRLLEVMAFGCVPVVLSDGWVLPFDRCIPWTEISLHLPESSIRHLPEILQRIPRDQVIALQTRVIAAYRRFFGSFDLIVEGLFREIETIIGQADADIG